MARIEVVLRKLAQYRAINGLKSTRAWLPLQDYLKRTNSTGCGYIDYWYLYQWVRRYKPTEILELGTGASTIVLAHALMENGHGGRVTSMEEVESWYRHALELLPPKLPVELVLSDTVEDKFSIFRGMRYRNIPDRPYDMVFVDGPKYTNESGDVLFDFDLISIISKADKPLRAIIDKRVSTCYVMQRVLPGKVRYKRHLGLGFVDAVTKDDLRSISAETPSTSFELATIIDFAGV